MGEGWFIPGLTEVKYDHIPTIVIQECRVVNRKLDLNLWEKDWLHHRRGDKVPEGLKRWV